MEIMTNKLWQGCLKCKGKRCCHGYLPISIFTTIEEKKRLPKINTKSPCAYLNKGGLCSVHGIKPFDCRLFPFDLIKESGRFYWVIWDVDCPIITHERDRFNDYLYEHETGLIPLVKDFLEEFNEWEDAEYKEKFKYEILRELKTWKVK